MKSCSRFLMTSRQSVVFSINLQTSLSGLEGATFSSARWALLFRNLTFGGDITAWVGSVCSRVVLGSPWSLNLECLGSGCLLLPKLAAVKVGGVMCRSSCQLPHVVVFEPHVIFLFLVFQFQVCKAYKHSINVFVILKVNENIETLYG